MMIAESVRPRHFVIRRAGHRFARGLAEDGVEQCACRMPFMR